MNTHDEEYEYLLTEPSQHINQGDLYSTTQENDHDLFPASFPQESREVMYGRLCYFIVKAGTKWIKNYTLGQLPRGHNLSQVLSMRKVYDEFHRLKKRKIIQKCQFQTLYPDGGTEVNENEIDMSLWVILARNVTTDRNMIRWDAVPTEFDDLLQHHILRLRNVRNELHHVASNELTEKRFTELWDTIQKSLLRLGCSEEEIRGYKFRDLDPTATRHCMMTLKTQALEDKVTELGEEVGTKQKITWGLISLSCLVAISMAAIIVFIVTFAESNQACKGKPETFWTASHLLQYMPRSAWGASHGHIGRGTIFKGPVEYMLISHTATTSQPGSSEDYCHQLQKIQEYCLNRDMPDIAYNYLIGNDGIIYEGRGLALAPETSQRYRKESLSIGYIGTFTDIPPKQEALITGQAFIQHLVDEGAVKKNATVYGLCQTKVTASPGLAFMEEIMTWHGEHDPWSWRDYNVGQCFRNVSSANHN